MAINDHQFHLNTFQIATITGCPSANVQLFWPIVFRAMQQAGLTDRLTIIAVLATIAVEDPDFKPMNEFGDYAYFSGLYDYRKDLGNIYPGDGAAFHGRGFIQLTGRDNYYLYGKLVGVDLIHFPEKALDPYIAAKILVGFFQVNHIEEEARAENWKTVRLRVNGGLNGFSRFVSIVQRLLTATSTT
jgi:predicted chitinase